MCSDLWIFINQFCDIQNLLTVCLYDICDLIYQYLEKKQKQTIIEICKSVIEIMDINLWHDTNTCIARRIFMFLLYL